MEKQTHQPHIFYLHGTSPRVLLFSGMHGDEYESGALLEQYLIEQAEYLPAFLYIPQISPSAVAAKTRRNRYGNDINRQFLPTTQDPEARSVMDIVSPYQFALCADIHEDPDRTLGFYLYDTDQMSEEELKSYRNCITTTGARLYTGVDDVDDEHLMLPVEKGYVSLGFERSGATSGFSSRWLFEASICKRAFTVEIPGKAPTSLKDAVIRTVIKYLLTVHHTRSQ